MARSARVLLTGTRSDDELDPVTLDVFLDERGKVVQSFPTSGWWGKLRTDDLLPFIFFPSGKIDFGTGFEEENRYAQTNLPTKRLHVGEYVTMEVGDDEHCFLVKKVLWIDEIAA